MTTMTTKLTVSGIAAAMGLTVLLTTINHYGITGATADSLIAAMGLGIYLLPLSMFLPRVLRTVAKLRWSHVVAIANATPRVIEGTAKFLGKLALYGTACVVGWAVAAIFPGLALLLCILVVLGACGCNGGSK